MQEFLSLGKLYGMAPDILDPILMLALIRGKNHQLLSDLKIRMNQLAEKRKYEEAALLRDEIKAIATFHSKQKIVDERLSDRDIVTIDIHEDDGCGMVFNVREGKIINRQHFYLTGIQSFQESEVMSSFLKQYYIQAEAV